MTSRPDLTILWPTARGGQVLAATPDEAELARLFEGPLPGVGDAAGPTPTLDRESGAPLPHVRANMITTLDGAAHGPDGRSGSINGPADLRVFTVLRALAEVVLVGAGTVRSEEYRAPRTPARLTAVRTERGLAPHPTLAVVTRTGDLPEELLTDEPAPWVFTTHEAPHLRRLADRLPADRLHVSPRIDLTQVLATLAASGVREVLTEGGPSLLRDLLADGLVDELCLTLAPALLAGGAARILTGGPLDPAVPAGLVHLLHGDGALLGRWAVGRQ